MRRLSKSPRILRVGKKHSAFGKATIIIACLALGGCSYAETLLKQDDSVEYTKIARSVKASLVDSELVEAAPLRVSATARTIVLEGFVESPEQRKEAERIAEELHPNYEIDNNIRIR